MSNPVISVIVPVYNLEKYLEHTLDILLNQTYDNLEIILIDDGSSDKSPEICDRYAAANDNIIVIHQKNSGVSAARNAGIAAATGEYIGFCDGDDDVDKDMYEFLYNIASSDNADIAICGVRIIQPDGTVRNVAKGTHKIWNSPESFLEEFFRGEITMSVYTKLFKAEICKQIEFPENYKTNEDKYYCFMAAVLANRISINDVSKYTYYRREGSSTLTSFSKKYFDGVSLADKIIEVVGEKYPSLVESAHANKLSTVLRVYKLMYMRGALNGFKNDADNIVKYVKSFDKNLAKKRLTPKNYLRYILIKRCRPAFYLMTKYFDYN